MASARTKSPLTDFELLSPNRNKPRTGVIRRLTPHHVAGNLTAKATLSLPAFQTYDPINGASSNYAIGSDGQIGLGVEESNRAWTSSSSTNDHQSITVEIANSGGSPDWRMSDAAINSWLDLSVEQCQYYGFKKVNYQEKPSNITPSKVEAWIKTWAKDSEMTITLHNWFTSTSCPGPYFMRQLPWLVGEMNKRLSNPSYNAEAFVGEGTSTDTSTGSGSTTEKPSTPAPSKTIDEIAEEVIAGKWGNGQDRVTKLTAAGYDAAAVQNKVNEMLKTDTGSAKEIEPYTITIAASALNIRKGPGTNHAIVKTLINDKNVYTIVEEQNGPLGNGTNGAWGRLKSGIGWIMLQHTKKR